VPPTIPVIDVAPLFGPDGLARRDCDAAIQHAAGEAGFLTLVGLPDDAPVGAAARRELLRIFELPPDAKRRLFRHKAAPENPNVYRGWFPIETGVIKEGMDVGPDPVPPGAPARAGDALAEPTPFPEESSLPGWRAGVREGFRALEGVGHALMRSLARGLGLPETWFDEAFRDGNSTLRLIEYPPWPERAAHHDLPLRPLVSTDGVRRYDIGGAHVDSGLVTLLQQDEVGGLQARVGGDAWLDVPPREGSLVVNFGKLLERWSGGRVRATEHRVLGNECTRHSIPFFYEPRIDARIEPMPVDGAEPFEPFSYGDHLWDAMSRFAEFAGIPRWPGGAPAEAGSR
jgi:isopenicillin N synthase-like dioxygenase